MRGSSLSVDRIRWAAAAIILTSAATLFIATRGAEAGVKGPAALPTTVRLGDAVELGTPALAAVAQVSGRTLIWHFGDGTSAEGRRVRHVYRKSGYYIITLTVPGATGGRAISGRVVHVEPVSKVADAAGTPGTTGSQTPASVPALGLKLQLLPQARHGLLKHGLALQVSSTGTADGFASVSLPRALAKLAGFKAGRRLSVVVATGTVSQVRAGTRKLHLRFASSLVKRLGRLQNLTLLVRMTLVDSAGTRAAADVSGTY